MSKEGFGKVFQSVMRNPALSVEAKAVYAYLSSFAGSGDTCFPSVELMQRELHIGKNRLTKNLKQLEDSGVIVKTREKNGNLLGRNTYKIIHNPDSFGEIDSRPLEDEALDSRPLEDEALDSRPLENRPEKKNNQKKNNFNTNDYKEVVGSFNEICQSYPKVMKISEARKKSIRARFAAGYTLEDFQKLFEMAEDSSFLKGQNSRNWRADFDWLIADRNMPKVIEGRYSDKQQEGGTNDEEERGTGYILFK